MKTRTISPTSAEGAAEKVRAPGWLSDMGARVLTLDKLTDEPQIAAPYRACGMWGVECRQRVQVAVGN